jgi:diguanylate cyclase (GGDEF)-like protein
MNQIFNFDKTQLLFYKFELFTKNLKFGLLANFASSLIVLYITFHHTPFVYLLLWFIYFSINTVNCMVINYQIHHNYHSIKPETWKRLIIFSYTALGLAWGMVPYFIMSFQDPITQTIILVMILGIFAGATIFLSAYRHAYTGFLLSAYIPLTLWFLLHLNYYLPLFFASCIFIPAMLIISKITSNLFSETLSLRLQSLFLIEGITHAEKSLVYLATHDPLTDLPNRNLFYDRLQQALALANRNQKGCALLFIDLDGFKEVNDLMGHAGGDAVLKEVASQLQSCIRQTDTLARIGGDEFVIIVNQVSDAKDLELVLEKISQLIIETNLSINTNKPIKFSIGISLYPKDSIFSDILLKKADAAMYQAKQQGGNCFVFASEYNFKETSTY